MEAATPIFNRKCLEKYELKDNEGKIYCVDYSYDEINIYFEVFFKDNIIREKYFLLLDLNSLKKSCKAFNLVNDLLEAFNFIKDLFKLNKISIKAEKNGLNIEMTVPVLLKEEKIIFNLKNQKNNQEDIINDLIQTVKDLKNENIEINKRLDILEKWKNEIEKRKKEEEKEKQEKEEKEKFNSKIMNTKEQINLIKNKFLNKGKVIQRLDLLFSSSRDGDSSQTVHNKIDGKKNILLFVETTKGK